MITPVWWRLVCIVTCVFGTCNLCIVSIYYIHGIDKWQLSWQCDNLIFISHASKSLWSFSVTSVTSHNSLMSHRLHFTAADIPLQSFSDFRKVSRSRIIRSIRLLASHATVTSRHLYITSWAHCEVCDVFYFYPADLQWTQLCDFQTRNRNRKPVLAFPKTEKPVLQKEPGFGNPMNNHNVLYRLVCVFVCRYF